MATHAYRKPRKPTRKEELATMGHTRLQGRTRRERTLVVIVEDRNGQVYDAHH